MAQARISPAKQLRTGTRGQILARNASGELVDLNIGTVGQVLTVNGGGTDPVWASPAGFTLSDGTNTQGIVAGNTLLVAGDDGLLSTVSATDTVTLSIDPSGPLAGLIGASAIGDIIYWDGTEWTILPAGANNYVLTSNGAGTAPTWEPLSGGGTMNDFDITDGTTTQTIENGNTITFADDDGLRVAVSATDTVTVDLDPSGPLSGLIGNVNGSILWNDGFGWVQLPLGTAGEVLTVNGSATAPEWAAAAGGGEKVRSITIENPISTENYSITRLETGGGTLLRVNAVLVGSDTPSVSFNLRYGSSRSAAGTAVYGSGQTANSTTTGTNHNTFANNTPAANDFLWLTTSAVSGTVDELHINIYYS